MKKRLRGLLALTLALCMGLTMTVSAATYYLYDVNQDGSVWKLYDNRSGTGPAVSIVKKDDVIYAVDSGGSFILVDIPVYENTVVEETNIQNETGDGASADVRVVDNDSDKSNDTFVSGKRAYSGDKNDKFTVKEDSKVQIGITEKYYSGDEYSFLVTLNLTPYTPPAPSPPISYKIKYVAEDGAESGTYSESFTAGTTGSAGVIASAEELGFTKEGFKAKPQWLLPDGTAVDTGAAIKDVFSQLQDNAVPVSGAYRQREIVLTAQWEDIRYTVKYDANGGTGIMEDQVFTVDEEGVLTKSAFTYEGYDFSGWNTAADGTGTAYADEATVLNLAQGGETITLYAQWTELPEEPGAGSDGSDEDPADDSSGKDKDKDASGRDDGSGKTDGEQANDYSAATGDNTNVLLWTFLAMLAILTAAILTKTHKKQS